MKCAICFEDSIAEECIVLTCNHIFHKRCIYYANKGKSENRCALCRKEILIPEIKKEKRVIEFFIKDDIYSKLFEIDKMMNCYENIKNKNWFISGGFALFLYKKFYTNNAKYNYYDNIDIYTRNNYIFTGNTAINLKLIKPEKPEYFTNEILCIKKINFINEIKNYSIKSVIYNNKCFVVETKPNARAVITDKINLIITKLENDKQYQMINILNEFDLSCCKLAVRIYRYGMQFKLKFYFHRDFFCDFYQIKSNRTLDRVEKYKMRGIILNCIN